MMGNNLPDTQSLSLTFLGYVQAGFAAPSEEEVADTITVSDYLIRNKEASYLLKVSGDSMIDAGILPGDMVIFERTVDYKPGDIVIALTPDGYTIKYLRKERHGTTDRYYLQAANSQYPLFIPTDWKIIGVVISTFRTYN
jgi:repressor LexA